MANNVPPTYGNNPIDNFFQFFFEGPFDSPFEGPVNDSSSAASSPFEMPLRPSPATTFFDLYEAPEPPRQPSRAASAPTLPKARGSATAKYVWRRITGGRQRHEAKARLGNLQASVIALYNSMEAYRDEYQRQESLYDTVRKQHTMLRSQAALTLDARRRTISLMYTFQSYDKRLHDSFLELDAIYRTAYPELVELEAALHDHRAGMVRTLDTMGDVRDQAAGMLQNLAQLQEVYVGHYGRLPHSVSPASTLMALFSVPQMKPPVQSMPAPETLDRMPWHFQPPPPSPPPGPKPSRQHSSRAKPRPQPRPEPQQVPPRFPVYQVPVDPVAAGAMVIDRIAPALDKIFSGDPTGWNQITQQDLDAVELALRRSNLRIDFVDSATVRVRKQVALKVLGDPEASAVRLRYRKRQMVVHPDKTGGLPPAARAKADAFCKILSAALDELTKD